jgi:hypothetical protein
MEVTNGYNPEEAHAFRQESEALRAEKLDEAKTKKAELYIEYGMPDMFNFQIQEIQAREARQLFNSGKIQAEDIVLPDEDPSVDPETRKRYADSYKRNPEDRQKDLARKAYQNYPELFSVTNRMKEKFNDIKSQIPKLDEDIWSLSPRPTPEDIQNKSVAFWTYDRRFEEATRTIREIEACADMELGTSSHLDQIRFLYPGYAQEDFQKLFLILKQGFETNIFYEPLPSRAEIIENSKMYSPDIRMFQPDSTPDQLSA